MYRESRYIACLDCTVQYSLKSYRAAVVVSWWWLMRLCTELQGVPNWGGNVLPDI